MVAERSDAPQERPAQGDPVAYVAYELLPLVREACSGGAHARRLRRLLIAEADRLCAEWGAE